MDSNNGAFLGIPMQLPVAVTFGYVGRLVEVLHLPIDYWGGNMYIPGRTGVACAAVVNGLLASVVAWLYARCFLSQREQHD